MVYAPTTSSGRRAAFSGGLFSFARNHCATDDRKRKFRLYERHGVREYWLVDPRDELLEVWQREQGRFILLDGYMRGESFASTVIGRVEVSAIFED